MGFVDVAGPTYSKDFCVPRIDFRLTANVFRLTRGLDSAERRSRYFPKLAGRATTTSILRFLTKPINLIFWPKFLPGMECAMHFNSNSSLTEVGRRLGYDLYLYRLPFDAAKLSENVVEGFDEAASRTSARRTPDRFVRKWLQLRASAYGRGRAFDECVTPALLKMIDVDECPVTRMVLTHGTLSGSDWSVDRLNNDGGYAINNLAVMSTQANRAKGQQSFEEVLNRARLNAPSGGLEPGEWMRMAAMMLGPCYATAPEKAPLVPHVVPVSSHRLLLGVQHVQHVLSMATGSQSGKNQLIRVMRAVSGLDRDVLRFRLLADRMHEALKRTEYACDVWLQPGVMDAFVLWRESLDDVAWARTLELSRALARGKRVEKSRMDSWQLETGGYSH